MAREHQDSVDGDFTTPFGPMEYALTSGTHVYIGAGQGSHSKVSAIEVNGVNYRANIHLHLQPSGVWRANPGDSRNAILMSRKDSGKDATFAAIKKALAGVTEAWGAYIQTEPQLMGEAEWRGINNEIMRVEEKAEEARKVYEALANEHTELLAREKEYLP